MAVTTGGQKIARTHRPGFGDQGYHDQIWTNDSNVLKPEAQEMRARAVSRPANK